MILIALGANLPSENHGPPRETLMAALDRLARLGVHTRVRSSWYESAPVPPSGQPWFVNAVAAVDTARDPAALLRALHEVEAALGRQRGVRNAARAVDLDLLDYAGQCSAAADWPCLPHPRLAERAFVLRPLAEVAPDWRHPVSGYGVNALIADLPPDQVCRRAKTACAADCRPT